ncbi:phage tail sheath family protein [Schlesneria paludicola]|uniref:phage tail sheath family protein n=1 Tax=Schlesneria paludicola TaxID=360056 RepID=UPI000299E4DD|nr:phage tail sheath C-terminal domain-containing protein [Schlesneria paludicola]
MPSALTYPGVYVEEVPSGLRTVVGVATSVTAFLGRATRGPTTGPGISVFSFDEFERRFGGLSLEYPLTFAVRDYFLNGGSQAVIVRLVRYDSEANNATLNAAVKAAEDALIGHEDDAALQKDLRDAQNLQNVTAETAKISLAAEDDSNAATKSEPLDLTASSHGNWGNHLWIKALVQVSDDNGNLKKRYHVEDSSDLFDLTIVERVPLYSKNGVPIYQVLQLETIRNIVFKKDSKSSRRIDRVLSTESQLLSANNTKLSDKNPLPIFELDETGRRIALMAGVANSAATAKFGPMLGEEFSTQLPKVSGAATKVAIAATLAGKTDADIAQDADKVASDIADAIKAKKQDTEIETIVKTALAAMEAAVPARQFEGGRNGQELLPVDYKFKARLQRVDIFNLMCLPPDSIDGEIDPKTTILADALDYCVKRRAMLIIDPPLSWKAAGSDVAAVVDAPSTRLADLNLNGPETRNAAVYFPRVTQSNPVRDGVVEAFVPCGIIAGRMSATDVSRGVWKAPAGIDASVGGTVGLDYDLTDDEHGQLNPVGINCLRGFPIYGRVIWGSRTLRGADALADEYKYVPVRRLALYIEESLVRGTKWVVHEPNGEVLWSQIRANVGAFMQNLFLNGALAGTSPQQAYYVNCDKTTNPDNFVNLGIVTIKVGFAPLRPAEFVVIQLSQIVGTTG